MIVADTQAWLWWLHEPARLTVRARTAFQHEESRHGIRVSAISVWEVAVKVALGKLEIPVEIGEWYRLASTAPGIVIEPLAALDAIASTQLPGAFHKDPADRMIVALARRHAVPLVTSDDAIRAYPHVVTLW